MCEGVISVDCVYYLNAYNSCQPPLDDGLSYALNIHGLSRIYCIWLNDYYIAVHLKIKIKIR